MMASPSELSLDCKPHSYSMILKSIGEVQHTDQTQKLEEILSRLEEERLKIDAFKRELPLCMQLLTNAMETSRQQLQNCRANQGPRPVLEEFIPLKISTSERSEKASTLTMADNKANWMTSAQLWSQASSNDHHQGLISNQSSAIVPTLSPNKENSDQISFNNHVVTGPKLGLDGAIQKNGGAFVPFSKERNPSSGPLHALPDLALANSTDKDAEDNKKCLENDSCLRRSDKGCNGATLEQGERKGGGGDVVADNHNTTTGTPASSQTHRKARRCWSPDLHRRFVNALQMLGGSQVATPKQIRELMKVDGLTNDEVKSHLQKYRLHTRRPSPNPQAAGNPAPQLVVLGGIWVPPEYATAGGPTIYGAHPTSHANSHYCGAQQVPQEFYPAPVMPPQLHHHHHALHHQLHHHHVYKQPSQNQSSPESDGRVATGDRSESIEDGKSESGGSWKADSGGGGSGNGGERKGVGLREDGEESNGSEITLKF